jgi:multiple antibiotic resistance protein
VLEPTVVFTLFFITLGPLKLLGPFARKTQALSVADLHQVSLWAFVIATISVVVGGIGGAWLLANWHVSLPALLLAAGIVFFLVAIKILLDQYAPEHAVVASQPLPASPPVAACSLVFPIVLTPYGLAAMIALLENSDSSERSVMIMLMAALVMLFNLLAMWFVRQILVGIVPVILQVIGAVLGILQVALSIQIIIAGLHALKLISA